MPPPPRCAIEYSAELMTPRRCPASCAAIATMPANMGVASLVPPTMVHPVSSGSYDAYAITPPSSAAESTTSGVPRCVPTTSLTPFWNAGREKMVLSPPPPAP